MPNVIDVNRLCMGCMSALDRTSGACPICGYDEAEPVPETHRLRPKSILNGKYLVGRALGEGGFGITYLGWDLNLNVRVAIKEYFPAGLVTRRNSAASATAQSFTGSQHDIFVKGRDHFLEEARSLARFRALPGIVSVSDFFTENGTAYIVMEYIEGQTLKEYLARSGGSLPAERVLKLMSPVLSSLARIHAEGVIHRDISPDNIMLDKDGTAKLLDFGAAKEFSEGERSMSVMLKPGYTPVEQYQSRGAQGPYTDIYALCATIYKMITGQTPPDALDRLETDTLEPPSRLGFSVEAGVERALMKGLAVSRQSRYQTVDALCADLYGESPTPLPEPEPVPDPPVPPQPQPQPQPEPPSPFMGRIVKALPVIFTASNALVVIVGIYVLSEFGGLWPIPLLFACNLVYQLVILIKKRTPSPAERKLHGAALAALLLGMQWQHHYMLGVLSDGRLGFDSYAIIFGFLIFGMLVLFAEALFIALTVRRAARGDRKTQVFDICLFCVLAAAPVVFFAAGGLPHLYTQPADVSASAGPSGNTAAVPEDGDDQPEYIDAIAKLIADDYVISIFCIDDNTVAAALENVFTAHSLSVEIHRYYSGDTWDRLRMQYDSGELPDFFVLTDLIYTPKIIAAGIGQPAGNLFAREWEPSLPGWEACTVSMSYGSGHRVELAAVMDELARKGSDLNSEWVSAIDEVKNGAK